MTRLDDYLSRIGLPAVTGALDLAALHRAHVVSIPFENLDPRRGVPVSLDPDALHAKLVGARRGGYCFEQNLLLAGALRDLGAGVELMLGRVRLGRPRDAPRPRTHLVLRVEWAGRTWLADAGFGAGTLLEPIPFGPGDEHEQSGWRFRIVADGDEHVLQTSSGDGWEDLYGFVPEPVPVVDVETSNWFTCTHPRSPFVTGLLVTAHRPDGSRVTLSDWSGLSLVEERPGARTATEVSGKQIPALLADRFGLPSSLDA